MLLSQGIAANQQLSVMSDHSFLSQYWLILQKLLGMNGLVNTVAAWYAPRKKAFFH